MPRSFAWKATPFGSLAVHGLMPGTTPIGGTFAASRQERGWATRYVIGGQAAARSVIGSTIHIEDLLALPETEFPEQVAANGACTAPARTVLATPLLREDVPIGRHLHATE